MKTLIALCLILACAPLMAQTPIPVTDPNLPPVVVGIYAGYQNPGVPAGFGGGFVAIHMTGNLYNYNAADLGLAPKVAGVSRTLQFSGFEGIATKMWQVTDWLSLWQTAAAGAVTSKTVSAGALKISGFALEKLSKKGIGLLQELEFQHAGAGIGDSLEARLAITFGAPAPTK